MAGYAEALEAHRNMLEVLIDQYHNKDDKTRLYGVACGVFVLADAMNGMAREMAKEYMGRCRCDDKTEGE